MSSSTSWHSPKQLEQLAQLIERTNPSGSVVRHALRLRILNLVEAVGRVDDGTEYSAAFREFAADEPSHADLAKRHRAIAGADDPLDPALCFGVALTELNAAARTRWARRDRKKLVNRPHPLRDVFSDMLTAEELDDVRAMAVDCAAYHSSFVRRGAPQKFDLDTLVEGLADIFIEFAKLRCNRCDLPHGVDTRFVKFVYHALRPFFGKTEATLKSISRRWKRIKDADGLARR